MKKNLDEVAEEIAEEIANKIIDKLWAKLRNTVFIPSTFPDEDASLNQWTDTGHTYTIPDSDGRSGKWRIIKIPDSDSRSRNF